MNIKQIHSDKEKENITRMILESLPEWFGIPEAREAYIAESKGNPFSVRWMEKPQWDFSI